MCCFDIFFLIVSKLVRGRARGGAIATSLPRRQHTRRLSIPLSPRCGLAFIQASNVEISLSALSVRMNRVRETVSEVRDECSGELKASERRAAARLQTATIAHQDAHDKVRALYSIRVLGIRTVRLSRVVN